MSVRIYELSKQMEMSNKELIALLLERGFAIKSASSTIDDISAEGLIQEFAPKASPQKADKPTAEKPEAPQADKAGLKASASAKTAESRPAGESGLPPGVFVKSKEQVERERSQKGGKEPAPSVLKKEGLKPASAPTPAPASTPPLPPATDTQESDAAQDGEGPPMRSIQLKSPIIVRDFAERLGIKPFRLISELMELGLFASMNQIIEDATATQIAKKHGFLLDIRHRGEQAAPQQPSKKKEPEVKNFPLEPRPPVVCVLGHVDHGKTTLLDAIRKANQVAKEAGGITQHIGAYQVEQGGSKITFIDTPGHAAFSKMRERGAQITDIAILVVAADDGFKPQTEEALKFARASQVPIIVAINKVDAKGADIDRVKQQLQERDLTPEDWGGETIAVPISALKGEGIDSLLEMILLQAELMELKAPIQGSATGMVIESQKEIGCGSTASVIIQEGTLSVGNALVCNQSYCRVRSLIDDKGKAVKKAGPATPVKVIGWSGTPEAGTVFRIESNERAAKKAAEAYAFDLKKAQNKPGAAADSESAPSALDALFANIKKAQKKTFHAVVKSDVYGTAEALANALEPLGSEKIDVNIVSIGVGAVNEKDVQLASAANAAIVGFNIDLENGVAASAKHEGISLYIHDIIYELIDQVKEAMADLLDPVYEEELLGTAEVRQIFPVAKGAVAGCMVIDGKILRDAEARVLRSGEVIGTGRVLALKRFKEDASEVKSGYECGIRLEGNNTYHEKDKIECFTLKKKRVTL